MDGLDPRAARQRVHRIDDIAVKSWAAQSEDAHFVLTSTLEHGLLAPAEFEADLHDAILHESGPQTRTGVGRGRSCFDPALESYSEIPE